MPTIYATDKDALPKRSANDLYQTEQTLVEAALKAERINILAPISFSSSYEILEPGCGDARWGMTAQRMADESRKAVGMVDYPTQLTTVDIDARWFVPDDTYPNHKHVMADFMKLDTNMTFDLIVGNFPYGPTLQGHDKVRQVFHEQGWGQSHPQQQHLGMAEMFIRKGYSLLKAGGIMLCLLESQFASSVDRYYGLWETHAPMRQWVCSRRPSFYGGGTNATEFSVFVWEKGFAGKNRGIAHEWQTKLLMYERAPKPKKVKKNADKLD
jgi:hypothetical protein